MWYLKGEGSATGNLRGLSYIAGQGGSHSAPSSKATSLGSLGGAAVWRLPLAQGAIPETRDQVPHRAPSAWSPSACVSASLSLSLSLSL